MKIEPDDFTQWRENPITQQVFKALRSKADEAKQQWVDKSWKGGINEPMLLVDLRASAEAWLYVVDDLDLDELEGVLNADSG